MTAKYETFTDGVAPELTESRRDEDLRVGDVVLLWCGAKRMATLAPGGRISQREVEAEVARLRLAWADAPAGVDDDALIARYLGRTRLDEIDRFDRVQLAEVLRVCAAARSLSDAGRLLFAASRQRKSSSNDADRLRKYLQRYDLGWTDLHPE